MVLNVKGDATVNPQFSHACAIRVSTVPPTAWVNETQQQSSSQDLCKCFTAPHHWTDSPPSLWKRLRTVLTYTMSKSDPPQGLDSWIVRNTRELDWCRGWAVLREINSVLQVAGVLLMLTQNDVQCRTWFAAMLMDTDWICKHYMC